MGSPFSLLRRPEISSPSVRTVLLCPFSAGTVLWQAQSGAWTLSVCVRGTFSLVHGREAVLADPQEPVAGDRHLGDDPRASVHVPSDLVPYKPRVDVVLVGSAFAPDREPVEALVARVSLGSLDKAIGVIGDRTWIEGPDGPEPSSPRPFRSMPLTYERAARARDNPHGFDLARAPVIGAPALPNLEAADDEIGGGRTVGFGPVAPGAGARRGLLRPEGWAWVEAPHDRARGPAPAGLDFAFYNAAPHDQQIDVLRGGDTLTLVNLDLRHPRLETRLPEVRPKAFLVPEDMERGVEIALRCDTLWIDTDRSLLTLSWRGLITVDSPDEEALGTLVIAAETKRRDLGYAQIAKILREGTLSSTEGDTLTEGRPLARPESILDIDSDLLPTPGPFKPKRPLPLGRGLRRSPRGVWGCLRPHRDRLRGQGASGGAAAGGDRGGGHHGAAVVGRDHRERSGRDGVDREAEDADAHRRAPPERGRPVSSHPPRPPTPPGPVGLRGGAVDATAGPRPVAGGSRGGRLRSDRGGGPARRRGACAFVVRAGDGGSAGCAAGVGGSQRVRPGVRAGVRRGDDGRARRVGLSVRLRCRPSRPHVRAHNPTSRWVRFDGRLVLRDEGPAEGFCARCAWIRRSGRVSLRAVEIGGDHRFDLDVVSGLAAVLFDLVLVLVLRPRRPRRRPR